MCNSALFSSQRQILVTDKRRNPPPDQKKSAFYQLKASASSHGGGCRLSAFNAGEARSGCLGVERRLFSATYVAQPKENSGAVP